MAFYGYTGIPSPDNHNETISGVVVQWLVGENDYVPPNTNVAIVKFKGDLFYVTNCFSASMEKLLTKEGGMSERTTSLLRWNADGEDIPYGRAHFITTRIQAEQGADGNPH